MTNYALNPPRTSRPEVRKRTPKVASPTSAPSSSPRPQPSQHPQSSDPVSLSPCHPVTVSPGGVDTGLKKRRVRDWGKANHNRGAEIADREYRRAHPGETLRSAYLPIVGETPKLRPGDVAGAQTQLDKINQAIARGHWTRSEWRRLHEMRVKYELRVANRDPRYRVVGNRQGGLTKEERKLVAHYKAVQAMFDTFEQDRRQEQEGGPRWH